MAPHSSEEPILGWATQLPDFSKLPCFRRLGWESSGEWVLHVSEDTHSSQFSRNLFEPVLFSEGVSEPAECGHASSQSTSPDAQRVLAS